MSVILVMIGGYISAISTMCPIIGKNLKNLTAQKEFSIEFTHNIPRDQSKVKLAFLIRKKITVKLHENLANLMRH